MTLNSYFLQGTVGEQNLVQDLVNEQLKMYGIEVYYLPRKLFKTDNILGEVQSSKFDESFLIEAYLNNYDGYAPDSDIMTKFGLRLKNEISLTISKERFEENISPFLAGIQERLEDFAQTGYDFGNLITRPKEGDLIYFPLGERLFEIKRVESEKPFYQLGTLYTYDLSCELYEYENELIDTDIPEVDNTVEDEGYITTIRLAGIAITASAIASIGSGYVREIFLNDDGNGYTSDPTITFSSSPEYGGTASAVAITTTRAKIKSIDRIEIISAGYGYTVAPTILISGGGGSGAAATCSIGGTYYGVNSINITNSGNAYYNPIVNISSDPNVITPATAVAIVNSNTGIDAVRITNPGIGYTVTPSITFSDSASVGVGTFVYNELVTGQLSGITARVRNFRKETSLNSVNPPLYLDVSLNTGKFSAGETLVGSESSATFVVRSHDIDSYDDTYDENEEIELEADNILDFTESNPFGDY